MQLLGVVALRADDRAIGFAAERVERARRLRGAETARGRDQGRQPRRGGIGDRLQRVGHRLLIAAESGELIEADAGAAGIVLAQAQEHVVADRHQARVEERQRGLADAAERAAEGAGVDDAVVGHRRVAAGLRNRHHLAAVQSRRAGDDHAVGRARAGLAQLQAGAGVHGQAGDIERSAGRRRARRRAAAAGDAGWREYATQCQRTRQRAIADQGAARGDVRVAAQVAVEHEVAADGGVVERTGRAGRQDQGAARADAEVFETAQGRARQRAFAAADDRERIAAGACVDRAGEARQLRRRGAQHIVATAEIDRAGDRAGHAEVVDTGAEVR
ncbi:hypothetical protein, partial [Lysobacter capsici]|uniref:hypothetical protein n=1 Tax=Lysobacter capsici TaxID=435897 RepID=UPI00398CE9D2